jgi:hypothetical protein
VSLAPSTVVPTVLVADDAPEPAALVETHTGGRVLVLRPVQSFSNAVTQITKLLPSLHPDQVRAIVRCYLPDAEDFDVVESSTHRATVSALPPSNTPARKGRSLLRRAGIHAGIWSVVSLSALAYAVGDSPKREPFESAEFRTFAAKGQVMCDPIDAMTAKCTDVDGTVMLSTVLTGPESTLFNFAYGSDRVGMRVFTSHGEARMWVSQQGTKALYDNVRQSGRYVFFGTDKQRVATYAALVRGTKDRDSQLPERITSLAVGALNLPEGQAGIHLVSVSQSNAVKDVLGAPVDEPDVVNEVPVVANYLPGSPVLPALRAGRDERQRAKARPVTRSKVDEVKKAVEKVLPKVAVPVPKVEVVTPTVPAPVATAPAPAPTTQPPVPTQPAAPAVTTPAPEPTSTATPTPEAVEPAAVAQEPLTDALVEPIEELVAPAL